MAQGKPQLKFERNLWIKFRDNCDTDGRTDRWTTDDGQIAIELRIRIKSENVFFFSKIQKVYQRMAQGKHYLFYNQNLKEIRALGSDIIATRTDDGRQTKVPYHDLC